MTKVLSLSAAALALFAVTVTAQAQIVTSLEFNSNSTALTATQTAGVDSVKNWNVLQMTYIGSVPNNGTGTTNTKNNLVNSSGTVQTGLDLSIFSGGGYAFGGSSGFDTADKTLLNNGALANWNGIPTDTVTLSGLNAGDSYSLIAYVPLISGSSTYTASVKLGSTTYYLKSGSGLSAFVQSTATSAATALTSDYVEFTGITGSSTLSLSLTDTGNGTNESNYAGFSGIQLIDTGAAVVPEPSSVWLFCLGLLGLSLHLRRKRSVVI